MHHPRTRPRANRRPHRATTSASSADRSAPSDWAAPVAHVLLPGETARLQVDAFGWRWEPADVTYDRRLVLLGGPVGMALTGIVSAVSSRRARERAERGAAPAWRPLGSLPVIATDQRLLVWHQDSWWSVWYSAIAGTSLDPTGTQVDLCFVADPPYRLRCAEASAILSQVRAWRPGGVLGP